MLTLLNNRQLSTVFFRNEGSGGRRRRGGGGAYDVDEGVVVEEAVFPGDENDDLAPKFGPKTPAMRNIKTNHTSMRV